VSTSDDDYVEMMARTSSFRAARIIDNITNTLTRNTSPPPVAVGAAEEESFNETGSQVPYFAAVPSSITTSPMRPPPPGRYSLRR